ncbi:MAG: hypothetical protein WB783_00430 [Arenicellales bacterium]
MTEPVPPAGVEILELVGILDGPRLGTSHRISRCRTAARRGEHTDETPAGIGTGSAG